MPDSVTEVGDEAFAGVKASRIVIPNSCGSIGSRAFANTKNLVKIRIPASVTTIAANAFEGSGVLTIETTAGSIAEQYARNHQIPVELIR